jgi:uncharacterized protein
MHPDHLPTPSAQQRASSRLVQVLLFPLMRLLWTLALLFFAAWLLGRLLPSVARLDNVTLGGALRNAIVSTSVLFISVRLLEGRHVARAVGLLPEGAPLSFLRGFLVGMGLLTAVTGVLFLSGGYQVSGLGAGASAKALGLAFVLFFFAAVFEEVLLRGIVFRLLEKGLGTWAALALSALAFGLAHLGNPGASPLAVVALTLEAGVLLAAAYVATRTLWFPIGLHTAWNFFEGPIYGSRVSGNDLPSLLQASFPGPTWLTGGDFGPEAGLPSLVFGTALGVLFLLLARRRGQLFTPRWLKKLVGRKAPQPLPAPTQAPAPSGEAA